MGMYDKYAFAGDFKYEMDKIYETIQEVWNNGYDDGQSYGVFEVLEALRKIIKWEGGISEEVIDIILNAEYNEVQEYADALEREIHIGDEVSFISCDDSLEKAVVLHVWKERNGKTEFQAYSPAYGFIYSVDVTNIKKTGKHYDIDYVLESLKKGE